MTPKPFVRDLLWMGAGALIFLAVVLVALYFHKEQNPAAQVAFKARRVELVERIRLSLASASEAEKSAVMATTDEESKTFVNQALAATATTEQNCKELEALLKTGDAEGGPRAGSAGEAKLLAQFLQGFTEFKKIDKDLLDLAVKNTNLKAFALAFGPAADALNGMDAALSRVAAASADAPSNETRQIMSLADGARIAALRIQALLAPHISEESDAKMDALESRMAKEDEEVRKGLADLAGLVKSAGSPDLELAAAQYGKFSELRAQIIQLSRENTNVRSLAISLNQKRKVMLMCQDALAALEQTIQDEPIAGVTYGAPVNPR